MGAPVERHVFDEVRQTLLIVGFEQRPGFHRQPQRNSLLRPGILADEEFEPVRQRAGADGAVEGERLLEVDGWGRRLRSLRRNDPGEQQSREGDTRCKCED